MKRLAKILAIVLLVVITVGFFKVITTQKGSVLAEDYFYGFNTPFLPFDTPGNIASELGYLPQCTQASANSSTPNTLRVFLPSSGVNDLKKLFSNSPSGTQYIVALSNYWGHGAQGPNCNPRPPYNSCQTPPTKWYTDNSTSNSSFQQYIKTVVSTFKNEGKVFMWEIMNEPSCDADPSCSSARYSFINATANTIANNGGGKLISPGLQGNMSNEEYVAIDDIPAITANTCHMYPESASENDPEIRNCLNKMEITKSNDKVFYVGEVGYGIPNNNSCTPPGVNTTTIKRAQDLKKIEAIFTTDRALNEPKADGFLMWRFDPPQSGPQTCDKFSVFPGDPICGGAGGFNYQNPPGIDFGGPDPVNPEGNEEQIGYYPPLGSLQSCPPEVPTIGSVGTNISNSPSPIDPNGNYCDIKPQPYPDVCTNPQKYIDSTGYVLEQYRDDICQPTGNNAIHWCPKHLRDDPKFAMGKKFDELNFRCGTADNAHSKLMTEIWGQYTEYYCDGGGNEVWQQIKKGIETGSCVQGVAPNKLADAEKCLYLELDRNKAPIEETEVSDKQLPACVPTRNANGRCTTTCGDPVKVNALLQMTSIGECTKGNCAANIKISADSKLYNPFSRELADYFAGTYDAGAVAEGSISQEKLEELQNAIAGTGSFSEKNVSQSEHYTLVQEAFNNAGVARKLLPPEVQDQLRCEFVNYVKDKVQMFESEETRENTKYIYTDGGGNITEFKINDVPASQIAPPPHIDPDTCSLLPNDKGELDDWRKTPSGVAWVNVPLFDNEESQGAIEFVSASPLVNKPDPIKVSIPDIRRLEKATRFIQAALVPDAAERNPTITPESLKLTIGPAIQPQTNLLACNKTQTLEEVYGDGTGYALEPTVSNYTLGVECIQNGGKLLTDDKSKDEICSVGTDGQINCTQIALDSGEGIQEFSPVILQTRLVQPNLWDTFVNTYEESGGLLSIFKPVAREKGVDEEKITEAYKPLPAESNKIKFEVESAQGGVTLDESQTEGWSLLFDKVGGLVTARDFVLNLLLPENSGGGQSETEENPPVLDSEDDL